MGLKNEKQNLTKEGTSFNVKIQNVVSQIEMPELFSTKSLTKEQLKNYINELEQRLKTCEEASKKADTDLLIAMGVQAQAFTMLSNIMKTKHDTATMAIQNIR